MAITVWVKDPEVLKKRGPATIVEGVALTAFGVVVLAWPAITGSILVRLVGLCVAACGFVCAYGGWSLRAEGGRTWIAALVPSLAVALFGLFVFFSPNAVGQVLLAVVALLAILAGLYDIVLSFSILSIFSGWWIRFVRGILLAGAGVWMIASHVSGLAALGTFLGIWVLLVGAFTVALGFAARKI